MDGFAITLTNEVIIVGCAGKRQHEKPKPFQRRGRGAHDDQHLNYGTSIRDRPHLYMPTVDELRKPLKSEKLDAADGPLSNDSLSRATESPTQGFAATTVTLALWEIDRSGLVMVFARRIFANLGLFAAATGWYLDYLPVWLTVLTGIALLIWGLNLDWRRKEREANVRSSTRDRRNRRTERETKATEKRIKERH